MEDRFAYLYPKNTVQACISKVADRSQRELTLLPVHLESVAFILITARNTKRGKGISRIVDGFHNPIAGRLIGISCPWPEELINPVVYAACSQRTLHRPHATRLHITQGSHLSRWPSGAWQLAYSLTRTAGPHRRYLAVWTGEVH